MWLSIIIPILLSILSIVCVLLTLVVLMQRPKNEGLGAAFGSSMTENIFGAQTATVLTKTTVYLGCIFFGLTLLLTVLTARQSMDRRVGVLENEVRKAAPLAAPKSTVSPAITSSPQASPSVAASASPAVSVAPTASASPESSTTPSSSASPSPSAATGSSPTPAPSVEQKFSSAICIAAALVSGSQMAPCSARGQNRHRLSRILSILGQKTHHGLRGQQNLAPALSCRVYRVLRCLLAAIGLLILHLVTGCDSDDTRADLVILNGAEPESIDPAVVTGQLEGRICYALFEGLLHFDRFGKPQPGIAENWDLSSDGKIYIFHLRATARWSNGDPVTADDFVRSWKRILLPETASEYAYLLYHIKNAQPFNEGTLQDFGAVGITAIDDRTFRVELQSPVPYFLDLCSFATLLPVHLPTVEKYGDDWIKPDKLVNNGPFLLKEWRLNYRIRLKKNPLYWDAAHVSLETIDALPIDNSITAYNFYASKVADLILDKGLTPPSLIPELKRRPDFHAAPFLGNYFIRFNVTRKPLDDVRVRQAFAMAIDRDRVVEKITQAGEPPAYSFTPPGAAGGYQPPKMFGRNVAKARQLLADAGYPGGRGFPTVTYLYDSKKLNEDIAVEIQNMLADALGVHIELQKQEWKVYLNSLSRLDYDFARSSWVGDYNDPNTFIDCFVSGGGNNRTGWRNQEYDELVAAAAAESDNSRRWQIFQRAEDILLNQGTPICPLYYYVGIQIYDGQKFGGIEPNLLDEHPFREMYRKPLKMY